jgi:signal transduction histidine kinase
MKRYARTVSYFLSLIAVATIFFSVEFVVEKFLCPNDEVVDILAAIAGALSFAECRRFFDRVTDTIFFHGERDLHAELLTNIYHELQTPIAILRGNVELLQIRSIAEEDRASAERVVMTTLDGMSRLIGNFLQSAKLKFSKKVFDITEIVMAELMRETHEDVSLMAEDRGIRLSLDIDPECDDGFSLKADRDKLKEVLLNLISNALKHTPRGGAISLRLEKDASAARMIVEDSGCGISADVLEHIFERFYRIENGAAPATTSRTPSIGIGLNICQEIIKGHGGRITAESEPGKGSRFIVHLPLSGIINA